MKKTKKSPKVRDMKPKKDAKGGGGLKHYLTRPGTADSSRGYNK
jgi:hypothetical protein